MADLQDEVTLVVHPYYPQLNGEVKEGGMGYLNNYIAQLEAIIRERDPIKGIVLFDTKDHYRKRSHELGIKHYVETEETTGSPINLHDLGIFENVKKLIIVGSKIEGCLLTAEGSIRTKFPNIEVDYNLDACYDGLHKYRDITTGDNFITWK